MMSNNTEQGYLHGLYSPIVNVILKLKTNKLNIRNDSL